jgi:exonuclease SbcC
MKSARDRLSRAVEALEGLAQPEMQVLTDAARGAEAAAREAVARHAEISAALTQREFTKARCDEIRIGLNDAEARYSVIGELKDMTSGANSIRMSLIDYAIAATFEDVLVAANVRFTRMSRGRFALQRRTELKDGRSRAGLEIVVHDSYTDRARDAHTLSGGESFMAALSLALGLSDVVQQRAGGIKLDVIFIDEGFGSLDEQTLDNALLTLRDLVGTNRAVGVISHVETVKQQIQAGFDISRGLKGSYVTQRLFS